MEYAASDNVKQGSQKKEFFLLELSILVTFALFKNLLRRQVIGRLSDS